MMARLAGDRIEITLGADEFIAFSDSNSEQILPIHGETETSGYLLMVDITMRGKKSSRM